MPTRKLRLVKGSLSVRDRRIVSAVEALEGRTLLSAGQLDTTFGTGGKVVLPGASGNTNYRVNAVAVQADGKTLLAGSAGTIDNGNLGQFFLERLNADGTVDSSFGHAGVVTTSFAHLAGANAVAVQADGKIVVGGVDESTLTGVSDGDAQFALARYNADGSLDSGFGSGGKVLTRIPGREQVQSIAVEPDGKIVAAGLGTYQDPAHTSDANYSVPAFMVVRFTTGGALDTSFSGTGYLYRQTDDTANEAGAATIALATQADGKVLVGGALKVDPAVWRFNADGSTDTSFGLGGVAWKALQYTDLSNDYDSARVSRMLVQPDGKILVSGAYNYGTPQNTWMLARFTVDGTVDGGFGPASQPDGAGIVASRSPADPGRAAPWGLGLQSDGKIIIGGVDGNPVGSFVARRYSPDGTADSSYQSAGADVFSAFADAAMAVMADGRVVFSAYDPNSSSLVVERLQGDAPPATTPVAPGSTTVNVAAGQLDPLFGASGRTVANDPTGVALPNSQQHRFNAVAVQADGKTVVAGSIGTTANDGKGSFRVERFNVDGTVDTTFGTNGSVTTDFGAFSYATTVVVQGDGRIIVGGTSEDSVSAPSNAMFAVARYTTSGALDGTFGSGGKVTTDFTGNEQVDSLSLTSDGKIVAAGSYFSSPNIGFDVARYNASGTLDTSFNGSGKLQHDLGKPGANSYPTSVAVQGDGKILVGSLAAGSAAVYRLNGDGSADDGFGAHGVASVGGGADAAKLALQADGKIVVGLVDPPNGVSPDHSNSTLFGIARLNANGSADASFGASGLVTVKGDRSNLTVPSYSRPAYEPMGSLLIQSDGKIILAADQEFVDSFGGQALGSVPLIRRFAANGTADSGFQSDTDPSFTPLPYARGVMLTGAALGPDGKLVISADVWSNNGSSSPHWSAAARYFTTAGSVTINPPTQGGGNNGGGGNGGGGGSGGGTPLPAGQLKAAFVGGLPASVVGMDKGSVTVRVTNSAKTAFAGPVTVALYQSTDGALSGDDALLTTLKIPSLHLKGGQSKVVKLKFTYPASLSGGSYTLLASVTQTNDGTAPDVAAGAKAVTFKPATTDLAASFASGNSFTASLGFPTKLVLVLTNTGSVTSTGTVKVTLYASSDQTVDASDAVLVGPVTKKVKIKPGKPMRLNLAFTMPSASVKYVLAEVVPDTQPADASSDNNVAAAAFQA